MQRDPGRLALDAYDVVVVGGGIYGACAVWEAASRGLRAALIEAADFGGATSSNSLRTLHGGLRHLQRLDLRRLRESVRARRGWLQLAPHLARPMRFVLPTVGHGLKGPEAMRAALFVNDLLSFDRNRGVAADRSLPPSRLWSGKLARAILTGTRITGCNGAATWSDAVCTNTERLLLAVVSAAVSLGARVSNYVRATGLGVQNGVVSTVQARDELTGDEFEIRTRAVIDAAGACVGEWMSGGGAGSVLPRARPLFLASKAFNLLVRPLPFKEGMGLCVPQYSRGESNPRTYFILPWNGRALVGTRHLRCDQAGRSAQVTRQDVVDFLEDLNRVLGRNRIRGSDVLGVYSGLLPEKRGGSPDDVDLERAPQIIDHADFGAAGVFSVIGVKWTTSRVVAERAVRTACHYLGKAAGRFASNAALWADRGAVDRVKPRQWLLDADSVAHVEEMYGPGRDAVFALLDQDSTLAARVVPDLPVINAQIVQAVREEMAVQLADIVMRRTPLYLSETLDAPTLSACAAVAARELHWDRRETAHQIERVAALVHAFRGPLFSPSLDRDAGVTEMKQTSAERT